jgi:hypothetical protein
MVSFLGALERILAFFRNPYVWRAAVASVIVAAFFLWDYLPYSVLSDRPELNWPASDNKKIGSQMIVADFSPESESMQTTYFSLALLGSIPFKSFVITTAYQAILLDWSKKEGSQFTLEWDRLTTWKWSLRREGDFPFETYRVIFLIGFNQSMSLSEGNLSAFVHIPADVDRDWQVSQSLHRVDFLGNSTFASLGIYIPGIGWLTKEDFPDCYRYDLVFSRKPSRILTDETRLWLPTLLLSVVTVAVGSWTQGNEPLESAKLCLTLAGLAMGYLIFLWTVMPNQFTIPHWLLIFDLLMSVVFLLANPPRAPERKRDT